MPRPTGKSDVKLNYLRKDHIIQKPLNVSFPVEFIEEFERACDRLGVKRKSLIEPAVMRVIEKAKAIPDAPNGQKKTKKNEPALRTVVFKLDEDFVNQFDEACSKLGLTRRDILEPALKKVIECAKGKTL